MEEFIVARYLFDQRPDGRYVPKVSIRRRGRPEIVITRRLHLSRSEPGAEAMDFWLLNRWRAKHAPGLEVVIES